MANFQAVRGDVRGRDAALGDDEPRREGLQRPVHNGHDGGGDGAGDLKARCGVVGLDEQAAGVDDDIALAKCVDDVGHNGCDVSVGFRVEQLLDVDLDDVGRAVLCGEVIELACCDADVRADHDQAAGCGRSVARVGLC
ncbi:hypothetical protein D3C73_1183110 [compost metagenome]